MLGIIELEHDNLMFVCIDLVFLVHKFCGLIENEDSPGNTSIGYDVKSLGVADGADGSATHVLLSQFFIVPYGFVVGFTNIKNLHKARETCKDESAAFLIVYCGDLLLRPDPSVALNDFELKLWIKNINDYLTFLHVFGLGTEAQNKITVHLVLLNRHLDDHMLHS